jgi:hypothetical protein
VALPLFAKVAFLEHSHKTFSPAGEKKDSGSFEFWLRFRLVTGRCRHVPALKRRQKPKIPRCRKAGVFLQTLPVFIGKWVSIRS